MAADWLTQLVIAAANLDQAEARATHLSESAQRDLLAWCLGETSGTDGAGAGGASSPAVKCTMCGQPAHVPALEANFEERGDPLDHWWLCSDHRSSMQSIMGTPGSPGRPERSSHDQRIERYRALRRPHRSQGPQPEPPSMPRPGPGAPRPGIWR